MDSSCRVIHWTILRNIFTFLGFTAAHRFSPENNNFLNNTSTGSIAIVPGLSSGAPPTNPLTSQSAIILFDYDAFKSQGFTDQDADINGHSYATAWTVGTQGIDGDGVHNEQQEETWLDNNSTPLLVNRSDGTLISAK